MIPGLTSKVSESTLAAAATISPKTDVVFLTGTTALETIIPPYGGFSGILIVIPTGGAVATVTTGNIAAVVTMTDLMPCVFIYSKENETWYAGAIS